MRKIISIICLVLFTTFGYSKDLVNKIVNRGILKVGTTGDYKPFTYLDKDRYIGYDIEVAKLLAKELGVEIEFVPTTWKTLLSDLNSEKYDIAMGGITRTVSRQIEAETSTPYLIFGKCFLVRRGEKEKYSSLEDVNRPEVRVGVNIGGTNEIFADEKLKMATIIRYKNNLDVPTAVSKGEVDVMVTETPEAIVYEREVNSLEGSMIENPVTRSQMGYLIKKDQIHFLNTINFLLNELEVKGEIGELKKKYFN
ncbi:MAG: transporter substrate-binding domain-containing protein [Cetobacterium sp.]